MQLIIGVDPSVRATGLAIIKVDDGKMSLVARTVIDLKHKSDAKLDFVHCLVEIKKRSESFFDFYLDKQQDNAYYSFAGIEDPPYCKSVAIAKKLASVFGVIACMLTEKGIPIHSVTPTEHKKMITDYGFAKKLSVQEVVKAMFNLDELPSNDEADAVSAAVTAYYKLNKMKQQNLL